MFALVKRIGSQAEPCDRQRFHEIIDDTQVSLICKKIFLAMVEYRAAKTEEIRKLIKNEQIAPLKKKLPGFCFLASFPTGHRCVADAVPSRPALSGSAPFVPVIIILIGTWLTFYSELSSESAERQLPVCAFQTDPMAGDRFPKCAKRIRWHQTAELRFPNESFETPSPSITLESNLSGDG